jgi:hypothetical protein
MAASVAVFTGPEITLSSQFLGKFGGNDAGWNGDDGVANEHAN